MSHLLEQWLLGSQAGSPTLGPGPWGPAQRFVTPRVRHSSGLWGHFPLGGPRRPKRDSPGWAPSKRVKELFSPFFPGGGHIGCLIFRAGSTLGAKMHGFRAGPQPRAEEGVGSWPPPASPLNQVSHKRSPPSPLPLALSTAHQLILKNDPAHGIELSSSG